MDRRICPTLDQALTVSVLSVLFLLLYELGAGSSFGILEGACIVTAVFFCLRFLYGPRSFLQRIFRSLGDLWPVTVAFVLYLLWDMVTLLYAPEASLAWLKYRVVLFNLFWMACLLALPRPVLLPGKVAGILAGVAVVLSVGAIGNRLWWGVYPIWYTTRLTLRQDYNMFAMTVLFGLVVGYRQLTHWTSLPGAIRRLLQCLLLVLTLPVIYLSGSRRGFLLLWIFLPLFLLTEQRGERIKGFVTLASGVVMAGLLGMLLTRWMNTLPTPPTNLPEESSVSSTTAGQRYGTIFTGGLTGKRQLLWRVAWQEAETYTTSQQIIGRGNGYDVVLYAESEDQELHEAYPALRDQPYILSAHNLFLADYLGGGWVKLGLCILLLAVVGLASLLLLYLGRGEELFWCLALWVSMFCNLISNRFGLLYDKFFCLFGVMLVLRLCRQLFSQERGEIGGNKNMYRHYRPSP